jgi:uncharacterized MAPEG superfamily protein
MASYFTNLSRDNISYYLIPAAWFLAISTRYYSEFATPNKPIDLGHPRGFAQAVQNDPEIDSKTTGRVVRAEAAQANNLETLGLFATAVMAGNAAHLDVGMLNGLSLGYLVGRLVYNGIYIYNDVVPPAVRSLAYVGCVGTCFGMIVQAGWKFGVGRTV